MIKATAADYTWLCDRWTDDVGTTLLCINFVQDLLPSEVLRRFGVTPNTSGEHTIAAYKAAGGTVLAESGWATGHWRAPIPGPLHPAQADRLDGSPVQLVVSRRP
ncbi:hypothetical protein [Nonomuraea sp. 10N515B]|uniref:hypothetical protein n=1 Tax=Nonomuraea sp. 10N515B TaxID=3457422 RepID=UPI003FCE5ECD